MPDAPQQVGRTILRLLALHTFICLGVSIFAVEAVDILAPPDYAAASKVVPILALASLFQYSGSLFDSSFMARQKTKAKPVVSFIAAAVGVGCLFVWTPDFGALGAASAVACGNLAGAAANFLFAQRVATFELQWAAMGKGLALASCILLLTSQFPSTLASIPMKVIAWFAWPVVLWQLQVLTTQEKEWFRNQAIRIKSLVPV